MVCTFFGHRDCYGLDTNLLQTAIEDAISKGADKFYVGNQGYFDNMAIKCLTKLKCKHKSISFFVVLAYLPTQKHIYDPYYDISIYPEGLERVPQKFAIEKRNNWLIDNSDYCIAYVKYTWGGAYKFASRAKKKGLTVVNLGDMEL